MSFESFNLQPSVMAGVQAQGYITPTPIQEQTIPAIMEGRDLIGLAQTGTGKTAAFALPILNKLAQGKRGVLRALVISPTRELAEQICDQFTELGKKTVYGMSRFMAASGKKCKSANYATAQKLRSVVPDGCLTIYTRGSLIYPSLRFWLSMKPTGCSTWASCRISSEYLNASCSRDKHYFSPPRCLMISGAW